MTAGLSEAKLNGADLSNADLTDADLYKADLSGANLTRAKLEVASMNGTILCGVKGLTKEQLEACKAARAIIDEDITASSPQSTVSPPASEPRNNPQAPLASPAQVNTPPDTDGSSATASQPSAES